MLTLTLGATSFAPACPPGTTRVDTFVTADQVQWLACEDLATPGGGITLVPELGEAVHMPKTYEPYAPEPLSLIHI